MREFKAKVEGGKIPLLLSKAIGSFIKQFDGKTILITIEEVMPKRSLNQNAYWFGVLRKHVLPAYQEMGNGWDVERLHEDTMEALGYMETIIKPDGSTKKVRMESKNFTKPQWEQFMTEARKLYAEFGIYVPLPNEQLEGYLWTTT